MLLVNRQRSFQPRAPQFEPARSCFGHALQAMRRRRGETKPELLGGVVGHELHAATVAVDLGGGVNSSFSGTGASASTQVSLLPPPCEEFTTSEPFLSATRVSPPGITKISFP